MIDKKSCIVSISWCASHWKGADPGMGPRLSGQEHAEWLEDAVAYWLDQGLDVIVAAVDFPGILDVETRPDNRERDVLWRILARRVPIVGTAVNPGHQVGAAKAIRIGLEYADRLNYDYQIHTAEDVLPEAGVVSDMRHFAHDRDYVGSRWGIEQTDLNAQFFMVRAEAIVHRWDACQVPSQRHIEGYLAHLLNGHPQAIIDNYYRTTHNRAEWRRWLEEQHAQP
jgi:hypothetical protein